MELAAHTFLEHETRALLTRLARIKPFVLSETMVPAANISIAAHHAIEDCLSRGRTQLREQALRFIDWLNHASSRDAEAADIQRRYALLRMRFNLVLAQFDLFADALSQRGDRDHGVWMAGLDALAQDALALQGVYEAPPVICYLDRGIGAAIRRARTRLPGGADNPAALIRVPRERMVGSGIASSLVHEVGHQAAALLGLVESLRPVLQQHAQAHAQAHGDAGSEAAANPWHCWERWISEIVADFWSVARLGIASTLGLVGVLSLPRAFVFRITTDDPHPAPWIRVLLSCAMGQALYPHAQWQRTVRLWRTLYPLDGAPEATRATLTRLMLGINDFVAVLMQHRPHLLSGRSLADTMTSPTIQGDALKETYLRWQTTPTAAFDSAPCVACAALGQARADNRITPEAESHLMARLLTQWALRHALGPTAPRAPPDSPTQLITTLTHSPTLTEGGHHGYQ